MTPCSHRTFTVTPALRPGRRRASVGAGDEPSPARVARPSRSSRPALSGTAAAKASLRSSRDGVHVAFEHARRRRRSTETVTGCPGRSFPTCVSLKFATTYTSGGTSRCDGRPYGSEHAGVQRQVAEHPVRRRDDARGVQLRLRQGDGGFGPRHAAALKVGVRARGVQLRLDRRALSQTSLCLGHPSVRGVLVLLRSAERGACPCDGRAGAIGRGLHLVELRLRNGVGRKKRFAAGEIHRGAPFISLREIHRGARTRDVGVRATYAIGGTCDERLVRRRCPPWRSRRPSAPALRPSAACARACASSACACFSRAA